MKKYEIWQISSIADTIYAFRDWECGKAFFKLGDYKCVYSGKEDSDIDDFSLLESFYVKFNFSHPDGYKGHSLSVSDLVMIDDGSGWVNMYYCDSFKWELIAVIKKL